ncbi:Protease HtpX [Jannaschia aquimarina]|uniref:HtpX protein n=1 Tax=Jannaschia aquimarina TaxID=935700 RepID=A0A0D1EAG5_9RHOB|nr:M48 family metalloprotease [Jannaschia aquimarina]KIT14689.1 Protease HtpX [Jannaschia aquimarina]
MRILIAALCFVAIAGTATARQTIIRDAEIEYALRQVAAPILRAAGLPSSVRIIVVRDDRMNAFVANSRTIFIHSGLLLRMEDAAMLQAVIAHEAAHIANGHLTRRATAVRGARNMAAIGLLLSAAGDWRRARGARRGGRHVVGGAALAFRAYEG